MARMRRDLPQLVILVVLLGLPLVSSGFFVEFVMTRTLILGIAAASLVFLSAYGGMVSLAQTAMYGIAGFMVANVAGEAGSRGLALGWDPWLSVIFALTVTVVSALVFGAVASRSTGIYFLMLTLTYAVIAFFFFGQVTTFSGYGGITGVNAPGLFLDHKVRLYYAAVVVSALTFALLRAASRTPFGLALQGIRDDPVRMASLGFNVALHRTLAMGLAGFVAGLAGVLNVWWNAQVDPQTINIAATLDVLIIAVIGGISRLEGAWLGAFVFVAANNYLRALPLVDRIGLTEDRFRTVIGLLVLLIMVLSPQGLMGILQRVTTRRTRPATDDAA